MAINLVDLSSGLDHWPCLVEPTDGRYSASWFLTNEHEKIEKYFLESFPHQTHRLHYPSNLVVAIMTKGL